MSLLRSLTGTTLGHFIGSKTAGRGLLGGGLGLIATRIATRSLPGAAIVGGGLLAKALWDRKKERDAEKGAASATGLSEQDADMAMARAAGETEIVEALSAESLPDHDGDEPVKADVAIAGSASPEQLERVAPREVSQRTVRRRKRKA